MLKMKETNAKTGELEFRLGRKTELIDHIIKVRQGYKPGIDTFRPPFHLAKIAAVCSHKGTLIGLCEVRSRYNTIRIFVERPFRSMGIGKKLLSMVCEEAKRQHMHFLIVIASPANRVSVSLYASAGFQPIGTIYLEKFPYEGLWKDQAGSRIVMGLALSLYGLAVTKICQLALRLTAPFSRFINLLAIAVLKRSDFEARLEWQRSTRRTSSNKVNYPPTNKITT